VALGLACGDSTPADSESEGTSEEVAELSCPDVPASKCGLVGNGVDGGWTGSDYTEGVRCALEAARDIAVDTEGVAPLLIQAIQDYGDSKSWSDYVFIGDGSVLVQRSAFWNGTSGRRYDPVEVCTLRPNSWYQDCLDAPDEDCTSDKDWVESCVEASEYMCPSS